MTAALRVLTPGPMTTIQDLGRPGYQHAGIPVSGALDPVSLRLVNRLVGNSDRMAGLEMLFRGPALEVAAESVRVAAAGARIEILGDDARMVGAWQSVRLHRAQSFRVGAPVSGATAYLAIEGGFALAPVLGSLSTYVRGGFGGLDGRPLAAGDVLPLAEPGCTDRAEQALPRPDLPTPRSVRVILGPQAGHFTAPGIDTLLSAAFTVSQASDRMGMRLEGPAIAHADTYDLISDGVAPGSIQVPGSGQPIVLLADRQTTGGYPKIATVISADLPALGRLPPDATIAFESVSLEAANAARVALDRKLQALAASIGPVARGRPLPDAELLAANLVSGFVDGREL